MKDNMPKLDYSKLNKKADGIENIRVPEGFMGQHFGPGKGMKDRWFDALNGLQRAIDSTNVMIGNISGEANPDKKEQIEALKRVLGDAGLLISQVYKAVE